MLGYNAGVEHAEVRTRTLIERELGIPLAAAEGDAYRDETGRLVDGEWLGAFAQPGFLLATATPVSATLSVPTGAMVDEYGKSTLSIDAVGERVTLRKSYGAEPERQFIYVGRLGEGTLAGYWYSPLRPAFRGVFYLVRATRMDADARTRLAARVRSTSWRKTLALSVLGGACFGASVGVIVGLPWLALTSIAVLGVFVSVTRRRIAMFQREVEHWRRDLAG